jgi:hypothetical protein
MPVFHLKNFLGPTAEHLDNFPSTLSLGAAFKSLRIRLDIKVGHGNERAELLSSSK